MIEPNNATAATSLSREPSRIVATDLFAAARAANALRQTLTAERCVFSRSRRLLPSGVWQGPKDAADAFVEENDLAALGGLEVAVAAGARAWVGSSMSMLQKAHTLGLRTFLRIPYRAGEDADARQERLTVVNAAARAGLISAAVLPTPSDEAMGLDTLSMFAMCRLHLSCEAVSADFGRLGHRLAQMALGVGANELFGPIVSERALRVGDNAHNPAMTRKEAAVFIRGASLVPYERMAGGRLEEVF